jgi:hypothetical protein
VGGLAATELVFLPIGWLQNKVKVSSVDIAVRQRFIVRQRR